VSPRPDQVHLGAGGMNEAFAVDDDEGIVWGLKIVWCDADCWVAVRMYVECGSQL
jgi:hypothetical protein